MSEFAIYAMKADDKNDPSFNKDRKPRIFGDLKKGIARFGWSYSPDSDLRKVKTRLESKKVQWGDLSEGERGAWEVHFLLDINPDDYLVYINMPEWGKCTMAQVKHRYSWEDDWDDFRHRISVDPDSILTFDRNDEAVHPFLSARLKLQGRWWHIDAKAEFQGLIADLRSGKMGKIRSKESAQHRLESEIKPLVEAISESIHRTHPNKELEPLIADLFRKVPGIKNVVETPNAPGADVLFDFGFEGFPLAGRCAVQVKSYDGDIGYKKAIEDLKEAFELDPDVTAGMIVSTALKMTEDFEASLEKLREDTGKRISVLIGKDLTHFYMRYGYAIRREEAEA